ncbi:30S ribosomal protein S9 [Gammaproteobacteria bacterium]|nr:30S ribosomal protein S9 [Gammaproteobacteria bacterium]
MSVKKSNVSKVITIGRRKTSVARLELVKGKGQITVNHKDIKDYFGQTTVYPAIAARPMGVVDAQSDFDIKVNVYGGGPNGQADAISLALARALCKHELGMTPIAIEEDVDEESPNALLPWRTALKRLKLLTRNARVVERKKVGFRKARKKEQYSKR